MCDTCMASEKGDEKKRENSGMMFLPEEQQIRHSLRSLVGTLVGTITRSIK